MTALHDMAHVRQFQGRYDEAARLYQEAVELWTAAFGPEHPATRNSVNNLANVYFGLGRHDDAVMLNRENPLSPASGCRVRGVRGVRGAGRGVGVSM